MRHTCVQRMNNLGADRELHSLVQAQVARLREGYRHSLALKARRDDAGFRLESEIAVQAGELSNKMCKATRAVAAHFADAAIAIEKQPRPIGLPRNAWN